MNDAPADAVDHEEERGGFGSLGSIVLLLVLTWAAALASFPLNDNSFFTHLATGRIILDEGAVPSTDPYTFTAHGEPWTVQSWLASVAYAGAERLGGDIGLRALVLAVFLTTAAVLWRLTRPATSILVRVAIMGGALAASGLWSERPYMIGVIGLGVLWMALEGQVRPWLLVPFMWLWVNTHGSFPLGLGLVVLYVAGAAVDRHGAIGTWSVAPVERRVAGATAIGTLLGAVGPVGPKILWFSLTAVSKSQVFSTIVEWQPPEYRSLAERAFLVLAAVTGLATVGKGRWRWALPAVVFTAAGAYAQRNVLMAVVVLAAVLARAAPAWGTLRSSTRPAVGRPVGVAAGLLVASVAAVALLTPALPDSSLGGYPGRALRWLQHLPAGPAAAEMATGNLLEVLDGPQRAVFVDDRVDVLPPDVVDDYLRLLRGRAGWEAVLDRYDVDVVVWSRDQPAASLLAESRRWAVSFSDDAAVVAVRRDRPRR